MKSIKVKEEVKSDSSPLPSEKSDEDDKVRMCFRKATSYIEREHGMFWYSLNLKYELRSEILFLCTEVFFYSSVYTIYRTVFYPSNRILYITRG